MNTCPVCFHATSSATCPVCASPVGASLAMTSGTQAHGVAMHSAAIHSTAMQKAPSAGLAAAEVELFQSGVRPCGFLQSEVRGVITQSHGPTSESERFNLWRFGSWALLCLGLLPLFVVFWLFVKGLQLLLSLVFGGRGRGGPGLFDGLVLHHVLDALRKPPNTIPVYHHVVDTGDRQVLVRQERELAGGRMLVGNTVQVRGKLRAGTLWFASGYNESLGAPLSQRLNLWPLAFALLAVGVFIEYNVLFQWVQSAQSSLGGWS